jgi:hypothetical protein
LRILISRRRTGCVFVGNFVGGIDGAGTAWPGLSPPISAFQCCRSQNRGGARRACGGRIGHDLTAGAVDAGWRSAFTSNRAPRDALTTAMTAAIDQGTEGVAGLTFPGFWGMVMVPSHVILTAITREQVAAVTVKTGNSAGNPLAQFQKPVTSDEVLASPPISDPIRRYDCVRRPMAPPRWC